MSEGTHAPAAVRYKEITATADAAAQRLREHESTKAERLEGEVTAARQRTVEADEQCERVKAEAEKQWNMAMSALWEERWMRVTRIPEADLSAQPTTSDKAIRAIQSAYRELYDALEKPRWSAGSLLPRRRRDG